MADLPQDLENDDRARLWLPPEILEQIYEHHRPKASDDAEVFEEKQQVLLAACKASRTLFSIASPLLWHHVRVNMLYSWQPKLLLVTMLNNPCPADRIRTIRLGFDRLASPDRDRKPPTQYNSRHFSRQCARNLRRVNVKRGYASLIPLDMAGPKSYLHSEGIVWEVIMILACCSALESAEVSMNTKAISAAGLSYPLSKLRFFTSELDSPTTRFPQSLKGFHRINFTCGAAGCELSPELLSAQPQGPSRIVHSSFNAANVDISFHAIQIWESMMFGNLVSIRLTNVTTTYGSLSMLTWTCTTLQTLDISFDPNSADHDGGYYLLFDSLRGSASHLRRLNIERWKSTLLRPDPIFQDMTRFTALTHLRLATAMVYGTRSWNGLTSSPSYLVDFLPTTLEALHVYVSQPALPDDVDTANHVLVLMGSGHIFRVLRTISITLKSMADEAYIELARDVGWVIDGQSTWVPDHGFETRFVRRDG